MKTLDYLGLNQERIQPVTDGLAVLLADLQVFYTNLRNFHWNVTGSKFFTLHAKFEELYDDTAAKVDEVAERLLQLGAVPESRYSVYLTQSEVKEADLLCCADSALTSILDTFRILIARERTIIAAAQDAGDETTAALLGDFLSGQEKLVWMFVALGKTSGCDKA